MKKFISAIIVMAMSLMLCFSLAGCNQGAYKAVKLSDAEPESYGYAVKKGENANILAAINTVIGKSDFNDKMDKLVEYYTAVYGEDSNATLSFDLPDLSDNTAGKLTVGTEAGCAPFEFSASSSVKGMCNNVAGVDIAVMIMVAEELNYTLEIQDMSFDSLSAALQTGEIDVIAAGFTNNEERAVTMDFSENYFTSTQFIVCANDKNYEKLSDLKDLKIGVQMGTTGNFLVADEIDAGNLGTATAVEYKSITLAMQALKKGDIDVIVIDELPAKSLVANN